MKIKLLIAAAVVTFTLPAFADFEVVSEAYELSLVNVTVPVSQSGHLAFRECGDCETKSIRIASEARFKLNGQGVRYDKFRAAVQQIGNRRMASVTVKHHLASDTVVSVSVNFKQQ